MYFLVKGAVAFVLPRLDNRVYKDVQQGEHFGHIDLGEEHELLDMTHRARSTAILSKDTLVRRFTTLAFGNCELLALAVKDLVKMKMEFPNTFIQLFENVETVLKELLMLKLECIKKTELDQLQKSETIKRDKNVGVEGAPDLLNSEGNPMINRLRTMMTFHMVGGI